MFHLQLIFKQENDEYIFFQFAHFKKTQVIQEDILPAKTTPPHKWLHRGRVCVCVCVCVCSHTLRGVGSCLTVEVSGQLDPPLAVGLGSAPECTSAPG